MFAAFFYLLRQRGLHVSLNEWMTLLEGMEKGLHHSTLTGFYHLCRAIVVKNETEFDRFDQIFLEFFKNVPYTGELTLGWATLAANGSGGVKVNSTGVQALVVSGDGVDTAVVCL